MRLLEHDGTGGFRLTKLLPNDAIPEIPPYAILSHTWGDAEVLFKDLEDSTAKSKAGYAKIQFCGDRAREDGLQFFWIDTCCIDKSDHVELEHALNSMFQWYRDAAKCYVYLADVLAHKQDADGNLKWRIGFQNCRWFTRGWTLQELIAPASVEFFSREDERLGDKKSLEKEIHDTTGIPLRALQGNPLSDFGVDQRMAWIEKRETRYEEDKVYALFGIFDVHIPVIYGEGKQKASRRLRGKIHEDYLYPCHDKERIELAKGGLLANAYRWVFDNPDFIRWYHLPKSRLLWIKGDPGKGKTMLPCGIINKLEGPITADGGNLAYFFCQATDSHINNATAVLRGLIHLLARRQPRLLSHLPENTYPSDEAMAWIVLSKVLQEMLEDPNLKATYLVIDALDECVTDLPQLLKLVAQTSLISPHVKWVVSSRNLPHIEEQLVALAQHSRLSLELNAESVTSAVNAYVRHRVLYLSHMKQYDSKTETAIQDHLSSIANGTFLWVALVCRNLEMIESWNAQAALKSFPPGLDSLYGQMLRHIDKLKDANLCKHILAIATITYRPLALKELASLANLLKSISDNPAFLKGIIQLCGSFLALQGTTVYFVHQSAKDFLLGMVPGEASERAFNQIFPSGVGYVHRDICSASLGLMSAVLVRDIYGLSTPGFPIEQVRTPDPDPLATTRYSCVYWVNHLSESASGTSTNLDDFLRDNGIIHTFLKTNFLYWLEALSLLEAISEGITAIRQLGSLLRRTNQERRINNRLAKNNSKSNRDIGAY
ncbi:NACHT domain-containing protein [Lasiosphaeris hirsuta]|uniref:NACHT domain-containing protein n=1 Tax=Lasiosphaeris hirsuta TaxID=260670 RepID=A0AA40EB98_9PEZI|nr:NACHT domain-containing protein [Lasiosphaeris hirsuta]